MVFGRNRFSAPFKVSESLINEARIVHIKRGQSRLYTANKFFPLKAGDTFIMKTDNFVNHWQALEDDDQCEIMAFNLTSQFLHELYADSKPNWLTNTKREHSESILRFSDSPLLDAYFTSLSQFMDQPELLDDAMTGLKVKELIQLAIHVDATGETERVFNQLFTATEYKFQEVVQANLFEDLNLEDLAFLTNTSLSSFKRKFSQLYGTSPTKYFISKRLEKAQELLETTDLRVADVAYEVGFSDVAYFSKTFKQYYNRTPSELKK